MKKGRLSLSYKRDALLILFIAVIMVANTVATKLVDLFGLAVITAGIIAYPITFAVTDIVGEVFGRGLAKRFVVLGFFANVVMVGLYSASLAMKPAVFWEGQASFQVVLGAVPRIVGASMIAYLVSQYHDVWMFHTLKKAFKGKHLWLRNNVSTMLSQAIDSLVFLTLAFVGVMPLEELAKMLLAYITIKWIIALLDTPLVYLGVRWLGGTDAGAKIKL